MSHRPHGEPGGHGPVTATDMGDFDFRVEPRQRADAQTCSLIADLSGSAELPGDKGD
jgi:hypothetical protein